MKYYLVLISFLLLTVSAMAQLNPAAAPAPGSVPPPQVAAVPTSTPTVDLAKAPKLVCLKPNFDFHNVDEGPDIHHDFHFKNSGKGKLIITNVGTSCGCTAAVMEEHKGAKGSAPSSATYPVTILPGAKDVIKATYHTSGRPGHATKIITVSSNDPVNPNFQMKLDMTVVRDVDVQPDRVYLYGVKFKEVKDSTVKILGKPGSPLHILSAESANKIVTVSKLEPFADEKEKRSGANLTVTLPATQPIGSFTDEVVVKTDNAKKPEVRIQVMGEVMGRVQFNPKNFSFAPHQDQPVTVQFTVDPPKGFEIRDVKSVNHLARPSIKKNRGANGNDQYLLIVSVVKNLPANSDGKDQIIVTTNDPDQPKISFDVQAQK